MNKFLKDNAKNIEKTSNNEQNLQKNDVFLEKNEKITNETIIQDDEETPLSIDDLPEEALNIMEEKKSKKFEDFALSDNNLFASKVWGILLILLREEGYMTIHAAGGEIRDIALNDFVLTVRVSNPSLYSILAQEKNLEVINALIKRINARLSFKVMLKDAFDKKANENLTALKNLFGDFLEV